MPLPPLAASERRLARFAAASTWGCALGGTACAVVPRQVFRAFALGGASTSSAGMRLFGALAGAALLALAISCRRVALRPREERTAFHPLLVFLLAGVLSTALALLRARGPAALPSDLTALKVALVALAALFAASAWVFVTGAPGVNVGPVMNTGPLDTAASGRLALGVKAAGAAPAGAPAAAPSPTQPAPAAAPIAADAKAPAGTAG